MRVSRLDLLAFGPFTDIVLSLEEGSYGLHLLLGPNEAGKSSALRALTAWLYGIPQNTADDFLHSNQNLRVGGVLQSSTGERLECVRRKGRKQTLRGADDQPVPPERLHAMLGGVDADAFRQRFGLDYDGLVAGGKALAGGKGELSELLFAAGSGISGLRALRQQLTADAEAIFKRQAQIPAINKRLTELSAIKRTIKEAALPTAEWLRHDEAFAEASTRRAAVEKELLDKRTELEGLRRTQQALPLIGQRRRLREQFVPLVQTPRLPPEFSDRRRDVTADLKAARTTIERIEQSLTKTAVAIRAVAIPTPLLSRAEAIEQLHRDLGAYSKAQRDRPTLDLQHQRLAKETAEVLRDLGQGDQSRAPGGWHVPRATRLRIQELAAQHQALATQELAAKTNSEEIELEREAIQVRLAEMPPRVDPSALEQVVQQARRPGDLDLQLEEAQRRLRQLGEQAGIDLRRLGLWSGALTDIEALAVPSPETVTRYEEEFGEALAEIERSEKELNDLTRELQECQQRIEQLVLQQDVPTEADLVAARERRAHGWRLVKGAWLDGGETAESGALIQEFSGESNLASAYEASVARADDVSDRLRREATQVADKSHLIVLQAKLTQRISQTELLLKAARNKLDQVTVDWRAQWTPVAIESLSPREMQAWLRRHAALAASAARLREQRTEVQEIERKRDEHCQALQQALEMLTPNTTASPVQEQLSAVVQLCEDALGRLKQEASDREALERDAERLERDWAKAKQAATAARDALGLWSKQWTVVIKEIGLPEGSTPGEARGVLESIEELQGKRREMENLQDRMAGIDREAQHFTEAVEVVAVALELGPRGDVSKVVQQLVDKLRQAREMQTRLEELRERHDREETQRQEVHDRIEKLSAEVETLCGEAGGVTVDALPKVEEDSRQRQTIERDMTTVEDRLSQLAGDVSLDSFVQQAEIEDADQLGARIQQLADDIAQLDGERSTLIARIAVERQERDRQDGTSRAADADQERERLLAQLREEVHRYARLRLASAVLNGAMERYRQRHQGPVLGRASQLFGELTCGSFTGLEVDCDDEGEAMLVGIRPGAANKVGVPGMSDGTRDQLYLALRLASLETWLQEHEPIPFVVDDILIKFDDERATAALKVLAELSRSTQVILFTHHPHVVDLAQRNFRDDVLFVHYLGQTAALAG